MRTSDEDECRLNLRTIFEGWNRTRFVHRSGWIISLNPRGIHAIGLIGLMFCPKHSSRRPSQQIISGESGAAAARWRGERATATALPAVVDGPDLGGIEMAR